jgi:hypothetical protein
MEVGAGAAICNRRFCKSRLKIATPGCVTRFPISLNYRNNVNKVDGFGKSLCY